MHKNFDSLLFLGDGDRSKRMIEKLKQVLDEALTLSSGNQQGPRQASDEQAIEQAVRDIAVALTGRVISFQERVRYPGKLNDEPFISYTENV